MASDYLDILMSSLNSASPPDSSATPATSTGASGGLGWGSILSSFGGGFAAMGAYNQATAQQAALTAQVQVDQNNATIAGWQAEDAIGRGEKAATNVMRKGAQVKGSQRAAMAANGVDLSVGSAQQVLTDTEYFTKVDAAQVENNATREAWGYNMQRDQYQQRAQASNAAAKQVSPWLAAGTSLLTSATSVASRWYQTNRTAGA
jgi:hypothetical protein